MLAGQVLYHLSHSTSSFCFRLKNPLKREGFLLFLLGPPCDCAPPSYVSFKHEAQSSKPSTTKERGLSKLLNTTMTCFCLELKVCTCCLLFSGVSCSHEDTTYFKTSLKPSLVTVTPQNLSCSLDFCLLSTSSHPMTL
jgi:hypothetical protein